MKEAEVEVVIANIRFPVPVCRDEKTTRELARQVNAAFERIQAKSRRIDTPVLALQTAFAYAAMAHEQQQELEETEGEVAKALEAIVDRLHEITLKHSTHRPPKKPDLRTIE